MKRKIIENRVESVSRRNRIRVLYESASNGLLFAGMLLLLFFGVHFAARWTLEAPWTFLSLGIAAGLVGGLTVGLLSPADRLESAREIDRHYGLKDRVLTASQIGAKTDRSLMERLQIDDAARHVETVESKRIVPYKIVPELYKVTAVYLPVFALCVLAAIASPATNHAAVSNETVLSILDQLQNDLAVPMNELARENPDDESIQKLNDKVVDLMNRLESQRSDPQEALLTLSSMEKEITETIREFDLEATDASLKEFGEALALSEATRPAAESLIGGDYEKGAEQLETADFEAMTNRERQAVGGELGKVAESMERRKQAELARMTQKLSEEIKKGDCAGCTNTACKFAGRCRKQCARKGACDKLNCQLAKLGLCKSQCAGACSSCPNKGQCAAADASDQPLGTSEVGSDKGGSPLGDETPDLDSHRELKKITGMKGDGYSETKTMRGAVMEGQSDLEYEKKVAEYKKRAEAVLETEPLPFEQHQTIRRYFESIADGH